jgi:hypothetical protein
MRKFVVDGLGVAWNEDGREGQRAPVAAGAATKRSTHQWISGLFASLAMGGDSHFYYTGSYTADRGKWRGELITNEHAKSAGVLPLFGGREVACGFSGSYFPDTARCEGTALVGKTSVTWHAELLLRSAL